MSNSNLNSKKRPSTPAILPPPKRQECLSSSQIPLETLGTIIKYIRDRMGETVESVEYTGIYWKVHSTYEELNKHQGFVKEPQFTENRQRLRDQFYTVLERGTAEDASEAEMEAVVSHSVFWSEPSQLILGTEPPSERVPSESQEKVVERCWTAAFVGTSPLDSLKSHVVHQLNRGVSTVTKPYGRYCSIVQSSGMGKSRLLDELSRYYFLIPINLRSSDGRGFPPADHAVRNFLTANNQIIPHDHAASLVRHFLIALFKTTTDALAGDAMGHTKIERIINFRNFMSKDQTMKSSGVWRTSFYDKVIALAHEISDDSPDESQGDQSADNQRDELKKALWALETALNGGGEEMEPRINAKHGRYVDIFITFDEAHTLTACHDDRKESRFVVLRRALSVLSEEPLFSFFLSTTGKITQFGQPRGHDASGRINEGFLTTPAPYIYVGFDLLVQNKVRRGMSLETVTTLDFIAHLGRPLWGTRYDHGKDIRNSLLDFAIQKLLCSLPGTELLTDAQKYAVLSQRLALDINTPQYLLTTASPLQLMHTMHDQVANHMRVCVAVGDGVESLRAVASSEPILSEAASRIMQDTSIFSLPEALAAVLSGFCINQGDRGELLVASFFTWARDQVVLRNPHIPAGRLCHYFSVKSLFSCLFSEAVFETMSKDFPSLSYLNAEDRRPFGEVFDKAYMHFNHFIKPQEQRLLTRKYLTLYMARGAAALGANCQPGFDAVYPFLYGGTELNAEKVGFVIVQIKNDSKTHRSTPTEIFPNMDPFKCRLLDKSDLQDGKFPIPIIRLFFSISTGGQSSVKRYEESSTNISTKREKKGKPKENPDPIFTTYDYECSGVSEDILQAVGESPDLWAKLVNRPDQWASFYDVPEPDVLRSQLPGCGTDKGHWGNWAELKDFVQ